MTIREKSINYLSAKVLTTEAKIKKENQILAKGGDGRISDALRKVVIDSLESDLRMYNYLLNLTQS